MKKLSHISFLNVAILALAVLVFGSVGAKTFAAAADFRPVGCTDGLPMTVYAVPSTFTGGDIYTHMIYVVSGNYTISSNIVMDDCSTIVVDENSIGATLTFQNGSYISSNTQDNVLIRGHADKKLTLINGNNSPLGIYMKNAQGIALSYLSLSGFTSYGIAFENIDNSTITQTNINNIVGRGVLVSDTSSNNTLSYLNITSTTDGIWFQSNANNNTISNTNIYTTTRGILLEAVIGTIINSSTTISGAIIGIYADDASGSAISYTTITNNSNYGIYLSAGSNNTINNNTIRYNNEGIFGDNTKNNTFISNTITLNTKGIRLDVGSLGNIFTSDTFSSNVEKNIELNSTDNNQFISTIIQNSPIGIESNDSDYDIFSGINMTGNTNGLVLNSSSYNTVNLTNNNNGITLNGGSNNNNIYNKQTTNNSINNITISNGSNNIITGGLFTTASTTSTSVYVNFLQNNYTPVTYSITGNGLSGIYTNIVMTGLTGATIEFATATNETKNIVVTYNNGNNKQYDSIVLNPTSGGGSNGGGGGGGGGGSVTPTCTSANLVCVNGVRARTGSTTCQGGNLARACTVTSGTTSAGTSGSIVGSPFSTELNNAYLRAFANGVTTMNTIQKANMTGALIRAHMAKMISNFAITLGGLTPDTSKQCIFTDIASQSAEMKFYIRLSCQLGLMGQGITKFDPTTVVTRAQFGTILSRVLWGDRYEGGVKYYTDHLAALKRATIMTQIENPNAKEIRGYVMIMMKRAQDLGYLNN